LRFHAADFTIGNSSHDSRKRRGALTAIVVSGK
jgi:hypothetical protein